MTADHLSPDANQGSEGRVFWVGLAVGWAAYLGINLLAITVYEEISFPEALLICLANVLPPAVASVPIAWYRSRLLRPEWGILRTVGVHLLVGLGFALATTGLAFALVQSNAAMRAIASQSPQFRVGILITSALFLYVIFFGFLMWSESMRRVRASQRLAAREAVLRAEAEARAIRAQFNPHFVFNTLHSLMLLVRADPALAERAIEDVATLIRYASIIQRRDLDAVPLAKELEIARRYVGLEKLRLQERLTVAWSVEVDPAAVSIPAFALQTLVENAIKHGLEPLSEGGAVTVTALVEGGRLKVTVLDNGRGASMSDVAGATGRGLDLLRARLSARHGEDGSLEWSTEPGEGFTVELTLPAEPPDPIPALDVIEARDLPKEVEVAAQ